MTRKPPRRAWFYLVQGTKKPEVVLYYDAPMPRRKEDRRPIYSCELPVEVIALAEVRGLKALADWYYMAVEFGTLPAKQAPMGRL